MGSQQQQFCLRWNNHQPNMLSIFDKLLSKEAFVDVTIACEGSSIKAHKMVLSACSPFFEDIFTENPCKHPIVIMKDIKHSDLKDIIKFMYKGEINVSQDRLSGLLKTAESLKVKGLADVNHDEKNNSGKSSDSLMVRGQVDLPPIPTHQSSFGNNSPASRSSLLNHLSSSNTSSSNKRKNRPQRNVNDSDVYSQQPIAKKRSESPKITEAIKIKQSSSPKPADRLDSSNSEAQMSLLTAASSSVRSGSNQSQVPTSTLGMILSGKENNIRIKSENSSLEEICTSDSVNESESSVTQEYILEPETLLDQTGISTGNNEDSYQDGDQSELIIGSSDLDIAGEQNRDAGPSQDSSVIFQGSSTVDVDFGSSSVNIDQDSQSFVCPSSESRNIGITLLPSVGETINVVHDQPSQVASAQVEANPKPSCFVCYRSFYDLSNLRRHVNKFHPGERIGRFRCDICNSVFKLQHTYRLHSWQKHGININPPKSSHW